MTPTKLSDSDKREILRLYQQSDENTITLSKRYGVSSSTVRRILQNGLSEEEYETLVQQKQKRSSNRENPSFTLGDALSDEPEESSPQHSPDPRNLVSHSELSEPLVSVAEDETEAFSSPSYRSDLSEADPDELGDEDYPDPAGDLEEILEADLDREEEFFDEDDEEDEDEDEDDDDFLDEDDDDDALDPRPLAPIQLRSKTLVQVLPLSEASLPKICYLVVDRAGELITRPLKAFGELGQIPTEEIREKTLPVFDNHRVARRFSARNQRVFKVPDGRILQKTAPYLQAKGITRLLIDGQVYSL